MLTGMAKPIPWFPPPPGKDRRIDSDQVTMAINKSSSRVSRVDRRICLNKILVVLDSQVSPADGADDAQGDRLADAEWVADGDCEFPHAHPGRIAEWQHGKIRGVHLENRDVRPRIRAHRFRLKLALVSEGNRYVRGALHHVVVREYVAVRTYNHS